MGTWAQSIPLTAAPVSIKWAVEFFNFDIADSQWDNFSNISLVDKMRKKVHVEALA